MFSHLFSGGVSIIETMTDNKYSQNFIGCIENITIEVSQRIVGPLTARDAISGFNIDQC